MERRARQGTLQRPRYIWRQQPQPSDTVAKTHLKNVPQNQGKTYNNTSELSNHPEELPDAEPKPPRVTSSAQARSRPTLALITAVINPVQMGFPKSNDNENRFCPWQKSSKVAAFLIT